LCSRKTGCEVPGTNVTGHPASLTQRRDLDRRAINRSSKARTACVTSFLNILSDRTLTIGFAMMPLSASRRPPEVDSTERGC